MLAPCNSLDSNQSLATACYQASTDATVDKLTKLDEQVTFLKHVAEACLFLLGVLILRANIFGCELAWLPSYLRA